MRWSSPAAEPAAVAGTSVCGGLPRCVLGGHEHRYDSAHARCTTRTRPSTTSTGTPNTSTDQPRNRFSVMYLNGDLTWKRQSRVDRRSALLPASHQHDVQSGQHAHAHPLCRWRRLRLLIHRSSHRQGRSKVGLKGQDPCRNSKNVVFRFCSSLCSGHVLWRPSDAGAGARDGGPSSSFRVVEVSVPNNAVWFINRPIQIRFTQEGGLQLRQPEHDQHPADERRSLRGRVHPAADGERRRSIEFVVEFQPRCPTQSNSGGRWSCNPVAWCTS